MAWSLTERREYDWRAAAEPIIFNAIGGPEGPDPERRVRPLCVPASAVRPIEGHVGTYRLALGLAGLPTDARLTRYVGAREAGWCHIEVQSREFAPVHMWERATPLPATLLYDEEGLPALMIVGR